MSLLTITKKLVKDLKKLEFEHPVAYVYNPLEYAIEPHRNYIERFANPGCEAILLGMNPGPFGMAQTGVPFGEVSLVRDWMQINGKVKKPKDEHPKRPILGFDCQRSEVSGRRLWGWAKDTFGKPDAFFKRFYIVNYCPLVFMEESGKNLTPDKLKAHERKELYEICDAALRKTVKFMEPKNIIGVGNFAEKRAQDTLGDLGIPIAKILHPSPQSPAANKGWAEAAMKDFSKAGIKI